MITLEVPTLALGAVVQRIIELDSDDFRVVKNGGSGGHSIAVEEYVADVILKTFSDTSVSSVPL